MSKKEEFENQEHQNQKEQEVSNQNQELSEVEKQVTPLVKVPINDYQKAAFIDFSFNSGVPAFKNSTMLGLLNAGNTKASCEQLMKWVFAGNCKQGTKDCVDVGNGKWKLKLTGLVKRRELEMKYCLGEIK
jgi:lysozyme